MDLSSTFYTCVRKQPIIALYFYKFAIISNAFIIEFTVTRNIPHLMFVNSLQLACNQLRLLVYGGLAIFRSMSSTQENWKPYQLLTHYPSSIIHSCNGKN